MSDPLSGLIAAYRDEHHGDELDASAVRQRVLVALRQRAARRRWPVGSGIAVAIAFAGSASLAATNVRHWAPVRAVLGWLGQSSGEVLSDAPVKALHPVRRASLQPAERRPISEVLPPAPADSGSEAGALRLEDSPVRDPRASSSLGPGRLAPRDRATVGVELQPDTELGTYRTALRLHFGGGDPARALAAWDEYLQRFPRGSLVDEARFNRAVCLVKLGRRGEAESVLEQLAGGAAEAHQRAQAGALLGALRKSQR